MEPIKIKGLDLKSEVKEEEVEEIMGSSPEGIVDGLKDEDEDETPEHEPTLMEELTSIIKRVEEWPKDDNTIKAIGKLKGALQLLS